MWKSAEWTVKVIKRNSIEYYKVEYSGYFHAECKSVEQVMYFLGTDYEQLEWVD